MLMNSTFVAPALMSLALQVGGLDLDATYLHGDRPGCVIANQRAQEWRVQGLVAIERRVGKWCVVGAVMGGQWIAEQWNSDAPPHRAQGWRVRIPLRQVANPGANHQSDWPLDVTDRRLGTRIRVRQSLLALDEHHQKSLSSLGRGVRGDDGVTRQLPGGRLTTFSQGQILVSGRDPLLGSYSILVQR